MGCRFVRKHLIRVASRLFLAGEAARSDKGKMGASLNTFVSVCLSAHRSRDL